MGSRLCAAAVDLGQGSILMAFAGTILRGTSLPGGVGRWYCVSGKVIVTAAAKNLTGIGTSIRQMVFKPMLPMAKLLASLQDRIALRTAR